MLTAQIQYSLSNARSCFRKHLAVADYYAAGQSVPGQWYGTGATQLGLHEAVHAAVLSSGEPSVYGFTT